MVMHQIRKKSVLVALLGLLAFLSYEWSVLVPTANAIPAFARKYNFSCNVCHVPGFPKLNRLWKYLPRSRVSARW